MATLTNFIFKPSISLSTHPTLLPLHSHRSSLPFQASQYSQQIRLKASHKFLFITKATAASGAKKAQSEERVQKVHSVEEFDDALRAAKNKLVVVEYASRDSEESSNIYPFMVNLSRSCNDVEFILVMGDESEKTRELCEREKIDKVPHFSFYKSMEKIHEEEGN